MTHPIVAINWSKCIPLDMGGYAIVYRVRPDLVAKVGHVEPAEVKAQRHFAGQALAWPGEVDYRAAWPVPTPIDQDVCPVHGLRREILPPGYACTCGSNHGVLLMPEAELPVDPTSTEYRAFVTGFSRDCEEQLGRTWDARPANVARYRGNLVALDFGAESQGR